MPIKLANFISTVLTQMFSVRFDAAVVRDRGSMLLTVILPDFPNCIRTSYNVTYRKNDNIFSKRQKSLQGRYTKLM
jgi:hypothetical protein